ncbi:MAG: DUF1684 domain-containing protein [Cyclobacteriaceae bacterium]|nr:DUF1684 domain-containing protein [Cyclobacteriaceae bacterium]
MKKYLSYINIIIVLIANISCLSDQQTSYDSEEIKNHQQQVEAFRKQKDADYKIPEKTMLPADLMKDFEGLKYYPIDYKYKVEAKLTRLEDLPKIEIKTSTGKVADYVIYGKLSFVIDETPAELSVYQSARLVGTDRIKNALFMPFTDKTSGEETFGGGRYLVMDIPEGDALTIDFNLAYNPYCVYDPTHSCPIPPKENDLRVMIEAGELIYP